ncbi:hypothetical protein LWI28_005442 [Acer negundo]|uniref:Uncharacterized protein n=1 Tax=Acer negundo TaxID=4023 RepID=A0AAD5P0S9_ACENE|nr:hypothetical protein LWI28_005442 [Acer negundo]
MMRDEGTYFQVKSSVNEHSCPLEEIHHHHQQASAVIIGEVVAPRLQQHDSRLIRPKDIIADMKTMYDIKIMYRNGTWIFTSLCADYYMKETLIDVYSIPIMPVGYPSSWVMSFDIAT